MGGNLPPFVRCQDRTLLNGKGASFPGMASEGSGKSTNSVATEHHHVSTPFGSTWSAFLAYLRSIPPFGSKPKPSNQYGRARRRRNVRPGFETLEVRWMPTLNPITWISASGTLLLSGTGNDNVVVSLSASTLSVVDNSGPAQTVSSVNAGSVTN